MLRRIGEGTKQVNARGARSARIAPLTTRPRHPIAAAAYRVLRSGGKGGMSANGERGDGHGGDCRNGGISGAGGARR